MSVTFGFGKKGELDNEPSFNVEIKVEKIQGILNGSGPVFFNWKCGKSSGTTKPITVHDSSDKNLRGSFSMDDSAILFLCKRKSDFSLMLIEDRGKKGLKEIGKVTLNLSSYLTERPSSPKKFCELLRKKKEPTNIKVSFTFQSHIPNISPETKPRSTSLCESSPRYAEYTKPSTMITPKKDKKKEKREPKEDKLKISLTNRMRNSTSLEKITANSPKSSPKESPTNSGSHSSNRRGSTSSASPIATHLSTVNESPNPTTDVSPRTKFGTVSVSTSTLMSTSTSTSTSPRPGSTSSLFGATKHGSLLPNKSKSRPKSGTHSIPGSTSSPDTHPVVPPLKTPSTNPLSNQSISSIPNSSVNPSPTANTSISTSTSPSKRLSKIPSLVPPLSVATPPSTNSTPPSSPINRSQSPYRNHGRTSTALPPLNGNLSPPKEKQTQEEVLPKRHRRSRSDAASSAAAVSKTPVKGIGLNLEGLKEKQQDSDKEEHAMERKQRSERSETQETHLKSKEISSPIHSVVNNQIQNNAKNESKEDQIFLYSYLFKLHQPLYSNGLPVAGCVIFRTLLQWRAFEESNRHLLHIVFENFQSISFPEKIEWILYWTLSGAFIITLFKSELKLMISEPTPPPPSNTTLKMNPHQKLSSNNLVNHELSHHNQFTEFVKKIRTETLRLYFGIISNVYQEIGNCVIEAVLQQPSMISPTKGDPNRKTVRNVIEILGKYFTLFLKTQEPEKEGPPIKASIASKMKQQTTSTTTHGIGNSILGSNIDEKKFGKNIKRIYQFMSQFFRQIYYYMNAVLCNKLLNSSDLCTCGNGFQIKNAVTTLQQWAQDRKFVDASEQLQMIKQLSDALAMSKSALINESIREEVCPLLTLPVLKQLTNMYTPDDFDPEPVGSDVINFLSTRVDSLDEQFSIDVEYRYPVTLEFENCENLNLKDISVPDEILIGRPSLNFLQSSVGRGSFIVSNNHQPW